MVINIDAINPGREPVRDFFVPTAAQTVFNLTQGTPVDSEDTIMRVNGVSYAEGSPTPGFFTVAGTVLTWLDRFLLDTSDEVEILYFIPAIPPN